MACRAESRPGVRAFAGARKQARRLGKARSIPEDEGQAVPGAAREIVKQAVANRVDLIVLTSHKIDLAHPAEGWGTTSYKVGILCQCPVLLVK